MGNGRIDKISNKINIEMDKILKLDELSIEVINSNLTEIKENNTGYEFYIWSKIPEKYLLSYFQNEQQVNPVVNNYEDWGKNLTKRKNPIFSCAIKEENIVSSLFGSEEVYYSQFAIKLWNTNNKHRGKRIGECVLLSLLKHIKENNAKYTEILAVDVSNTNSDNIIKKYNFK